MIKLDSKKAYDSVRWSFVDHILERMGFGEVWRGWIRSYLSNALMFVLNGVPTKPFFMQ